MNQDRRRFDASGRLVHSGRISVKERREMTEACDELDRQLKIDLAEIKRQYKEEKAKNKAERKAKRKAERKKYNNKNI